MEAGDYRTVTGWVSEPMGGHFVGRLSRNLDGQLWLTGRTRRSDALDHEGAGDKCHCELKDESAVEQDGALRFVVTSEDGVQYRCSAEFKRELELGGDIRIHVRRIVESRPGGATGKAHAVALHQTTLTHCPILFRFAERRSIPGQWVEALGLDHSEVQRRLRRPRRFVWDLEDGQVLRFSVSHSTSTETTDLGWRRQVVMEKALIEMETTQGSSGLGALDEIWTQSSETADDVILVLSFLQRQRASWSERQMMLFNEDRRGRHTWQREEAVRRPLAEGPSVAFRGLSMWQLVDRLPTTLRRVRANRSVIRSAILTYLSALDDQEYLENQYVKVVTAIEGLRDAHLDACGKPTRLDEKTAKGLRRKLRQVVSDFDGIEEALKQELKVSFTGIERHSFKWGLHELAGSANCALTDFFPDNASSFVKHRNSLVHTGSPARKDYVGLAEQLDRAIAFVERILCHRLGLEPSERGRLGVLPAELRPEPASEE